MTTSESKGRFFYKKNRIESIRITNRIESIRIENWNALLDAHASHLDEYSRRSTYGIYFVIHRFCSRIALHRLDISEKDHLPRMSQGDS